MPTITRTTGNVIAGVLALALTAGLIVRTSQAAFTSTTDNTGNSVEAGTVVLTDNDSGSALLTIANAYPGYSQENCIRVTYSGTIDPTVVRVYSTSAFSTAPNGTLDMEDQVNITIWEGTGGTFNDCTGFTASPASAIVGTTALSTWDGADSSYATGSGSWNPGAGPVTRTYRVRLEVDDSTGNAYQGQTLSGIALTWETRSP